jgi:hypothetical protein
MADYAPALAAPAHYTRVPTLAQAPPQGGTRNDSGAAGAWVKGGQLYHHVDSDGSQGRG